MKKIFIIAAVALISTFCTKEQNSIESVEPAVTFVKEGIHFNAGPAATKVSVAVDLTEGASVMSWEAGDEITIFYDNTCYTFVASVAGRTTIFYAKTNADVIANVDDSKSITAYYNVSEVLSDGKAKFSIAASQTEGTASNKPVLFAFSPSAAVGADNSINLTFFPLTSVAEFKIQASSKAKEGVDDVDYNLTKVVLTPASGATGYTVCTDAIYDPIEGDLTASTTSLSALTYNFANTTNIKDGRNIQLIVGKCTMDNTGATMDWYKGDKKNYTKTIWKTKTIDFVAENIHYYQPIATKVFGFYDYGSYYDNLVKNTSKNTQDNFINCCDDDLNLILTGDIQMCSSAGNRIPQVTGLTWPLDGRGHCLYDIYVTDASSSKTINFFYNLKSNIKNVNFGSLDKKGLNSVVNNSIALSKEDKIGVIGNIASGANVTIENCNNYINYTVSVGTGGAFLGGMVGNVNGAVTLKNCKNYGDHTLLVKDGSTCGGNLYASGFIGNVVAAATLIDCVNEGNITIQGSWSGNGYAGGLIAGTNAYTVTVSGCTNRGEILVNNTATTETSASQQGGGLIVRLANVTPKSSINNCVNYGKVSVYTATATTDRSKVKAAGIITDLQNNLSTGCTCRADVLAYYGTSTGETAWYTCWKGNTDHFIESGYVLKGIKLNTNTVTETNYYKSGYAVRGKWSDTEEGPALTLLAE